MGVAWPAAPPHPTRAWFRRLQRLPAGMGVVVQLIAAPLPADDAGRAALAAYAVSLAQQVPAIRDLLLSPAVTAETAPAYVAALAALRTAVQAPVPAVAVGAVLDGAQAPKTTLAALGTAAGATGQTVARRGRIPARAGGCHRGVDDGRPEARSRPRCHRPSPSRRDS